MDCETIMQPNLERVFGERDPAQRIDSAHESRSRSARHFRAVHIGGARAGGKASISLLH